MKKLLKGVRDIEDILFAAVIRNLKIVDVWNMLMPTLSFF